MSDPRSSDRLHEADAEPDGFVPLRLAMQPSGLAMVLNRPSVLVGRHSSSDIRLPLPDVSRHHCRFLFVEGCWQVWDLNSLNGVYVNGVQVESSPVHPGDSVRIGGFDFLVEYLGPTNPVDLATVMSFDSVNRLLRRKAS